ncbi:nitrite reductase [Photobacterium sp. SDRW27]|uniref:nitrite reductase n=1 Tax=Photobacterium obscurum TaxID=2829490 RepID=UPI002243850D|nr:nitrite reductase [Photobacterium obscurum]MCW8328393.1 nitrite reductase [Photobacterium obscurum]
MELTGVAIVAIVFTFIGLQRYLSYRAEMKKLDCAGNSGEVQELREELKKLQQRVVVLEKIVTDTGYQLKEEIKQL